MFTKELLKHTRRPVLYEKGTAEMWTDPCIARQLLEIHLNPEIDLGSCKRSSILQTID
jgi:hypothetical protein